MASTSHRRQCSNDPNIFCYICGSFTLETQRRNITDFVKRVYLAYFKVPLGDQDKRWAPHKVCKTCVETLRSWSQGKNAKLKFGVPMVWREPSNHLDDCYFCLVNVKGLNKKNKQFLQYPSIPSAIRSVELVKKFLYQYFLSFQKMMSQISAHLLLVMRKSLQIFFRHVKIATNQFCWLSLPWMIWLQIFIYQKSLLNCWLQDCKRIECWNPAQVSYFIVTGKQNCVSTSTQMILTFLIPVRCIDRRYTLYKYIYLDKMY